MIIKKESKYNLIFLCGHPLINRNFNSKYQIQTDCVDDFSPDVFTYNPCNDSDIYFKCAEKNSFNFGKCFNLSDTLALADVCHEKNSSLIQKIGYWKTSFPSDDFWK